MARPRDPNSQYNVSIQKSGVYMYACTQPWIRDEETGVEKRTHIRWGRIDKDNKFYPNARYMLLAPEERAKLRFPDNWDMSEARKLSGEHKRGRPAYTDEDQSRFYGDIWLLEQIAEERKIRSDLIKVFDGNTEMTDMVLTLAMFPFLTGKCYNHLPRWQKLGRFPAKVEMTPSVVTRALQSITERHRMDLLRLRRRRFSNRELCAVDSTSRSAYGYCLVDPTWGKNKEKLPLRITKEIAVYSLEEHEPVYYNSVQGNVPDSRTLEWILTDLEHAGFGKLLLLTDRGYDALHNLEMLTLKGQPWITGAKSNQKRVQNFIAEIGDVDPRPDGMTWIPKEKVYGARKELELVLRTQKKTEKKVPIQLYLYYNPLQRAEELLRMEEKLAALRKELDELIEMHTEPPPWSKKRYELFELTCCDKCGSLVSYSDNREKQRQKAKLLGFFAIVSYLTDFTPEEMLRVYGLRDEEEKLFEIQKSQMEGDRQRNWSEEAKNGARFVLFVGQILVSRLKHVWKTTELFSEYEYMFGIIEDMRRIRCIEHTGRAKFITPFVSTTLDVCKAFDFEPPKGCAPEYKSKQVKPQKKRGKKPKQPAPVQDSE